jgi:hypothetical protein
MAADKGGPRETEGLEPGYAYGPSPRQLPTRPSSRISAGAAILVLGATNVTPLRRNRY